MSPRLRFWLLAMDVANWIERPFSGRARNDARLYMWCVRNAGAAVDWGSE